MLMFMLNIFGAMARGDGIFAAVDRDGSESRTADVSVVIRRGGTGVLLALRAARCGDEQRVLMILSGFAGRQMPRSPSPRIAKRRSLRRCHHVWQPHLAGNFRVKNAQARVIRF